MAIINCPFCKQAYEVGPELIGPNLQCTVCNQIFPAQAGNDAAPQPPPPPAEQGTSFVPPPQNPQAQWDPNQPQGNMPPQGGPAPVKKDNNGVRVLLTILVCLLVIPGLLAILLVPALMQAKENARQADCTSRLKQIGLATMQYAMSYDDWYPTYRTWSTVKGGEWLGKSDSYNAFEIIRSQDLLIDPKGYICPSADDDIFKPADIGKRLASKNVAYNWCNGLKGGNSTMSPVACDFTDNHKQTGRFLRGDGSIGAANGTSSRKWTEDSSFKNFTKNYKE